jgi:methylmalonyl-CoA mutase cobalamin-binding domain/chain
LIDYGRKKLSSRIVMGVIGHDIHVISNRIIAIALGEYGYAVCNLSVDNTAENFLDAAVEYKADAVVVSSLNGEAEILDSVTSPRKIIGVADGKGGVLSKKSIIVSVTECPVPIE